MICLTCSLILWCGLCGQLYINSGLYVNGLYVNGLYVMY